MKLKKMISIMAVGAASMSILAGCQASGTKASNSTTAAAQTEQSSTAEASSEAEKTADNTENTGNGSGKTLVVYYSASGNTERVAKAAAEAAGADLFEIVPVEPYTSEDLNWTNDNSRVSREHNDESLRDVELTSTEVANWDSYDTVLIGYPIWWGIAAWPTDGFVKANDFTGKTVIPFCTAASSGIGQSGKLLADLAGTGDWQEGKALCVQCL
ncbi:MAG: flavodoxin [Pilosibacter sp.]